MSLFPSGQHFFALTALSYDTSLSTYRYGDHISGSTVTSNPAYFMVNATNGYSYHFASGSSSPTSYSYADLRSNTGVTTPDNVFNIKITNDDDVTASVYYVDNASVRNLVTTMEFNLVDMLSTNANSLTSVNGFMSFTENSSYTMTTGSFVNSGLMSVGGYTYGYDYSFSYYNTNGEVTGNHARFQVKRGDVTMQPTDLTATITPQQNNLTFSGKSTIVTVDFNKNILSNLTESSFVVTGGGTISNVQIDGDACTFIYTAPDNLTGTATISLAAGLPEGEDYSTTANNTSTQINYNTTEPDPSAGSSESSINFSMRACAISKENGTRSNTLFTGKVDNAGFQSYVLKAIQFIINNIFDKTYKMSLPRDGLMFFYLPTGSTQTEALSSDLLYRFLLKENSLTSNDTDTTVENGTLLASAETRKMFNYIASQLFPILRKGGIIIGQDDNTTLDFCATESDEGKFQLCVKNCLFELSLSF